jgi:hypothetical protein
MNSVIKIIAFLAIINSGLIHANQGCAHQCIEKELLNKKFHSAPLKVREKELPTPYDFLLTQPLITIGLEKHYQRTASIKILSFSTDVTDGIYTRSILMVVDSNKNRNDAITAGINHEEVPIELAFIEINFNELPKNIISAITHTKVPFGSIIKKNKLKTHSTDREYFSIPCEHELAELIHCKLNTQVYGRKNTIKKEIDNKWVARTLEILPNLRCDDKNCTTLAI